MASTGRLYNISPVKIEDDIAPNKEYVEKYCDPYYVILNRGDMTFVAPRYAPFFHRILFEKAKCVNMKNMVEDKNKFMSIARERVTKNIPAWSKKLEILSEGVHLVNPEKACHDLLEEIIAKTFNSKGSAVLKRYHLMFLARGGKEASQSSLRESRKQEGLGRKQNQKTKKSTCPNYQVNCKIDNSIW